MPPLTSWTPSPEFETFANAAVGCAIFFGVQLIMFIFGFEETKFTHFETLEGRQGSITTIPERASISRDHKSVDGQYPSEKQQDVGTASPDEATSLSDREAARKLSVIYINPAKTRKPYWQRLSLTNTSPGPWIAFLRHAWQPFMILGSIPGVLFCSLVYAILLAWSTVETAALSYLMLDPPYNFTASQIGLMSLAPCQSIHP